MTKPKHTKAEIRALCWTAIVGEFPPRIHWNARRMINAHVKFRRNPGEKAIGKRGRMFIAASGRMVLEDYAPYARALDLIRRGWVPNESANRFAKVSEIRFRNEKDQFTEVENR